LELKEEDGIWKRAYNYQVLICLKINDETFFDDEIFIDNFFSNFDTSIMPIIFFIYILLLFLSKILDENSLLIFLLVNYKKIFSIQCFYFRVTSMHVYLCV
jgi:hypothetical protein